MKTLLLLLLCATGCAAMMASWRAENCNYEGAYRAGMNDARRGAEMRSGFANACEAEARPDADRGYREGYTAGVNAPVAQAGWHCEEAYGKKACGYRCVQAYGEIACAQNPDENCVEAYGKLRCGLNCRESYGEITCDR